MMRRKLVRCLAWGFVCAGFAVSAEAQPPAPAIESPIAPVPEPAPLDPLPADMMIGAETISGPIFRDTEFGAHPHYGAPGWPGVGYPHQELRGVHYGLWYRPNSLHGYEDWACPKRFNPRGYGTPQQNSHYKLDYAPAVVHFPESQYGPYYSPRFRSYNDRVDDDVETIWDRFWRRD